MPCDIRAALAQVRSILDDIDRDLPPRALKGQEDYDALVEIVKQDCQEGDCDGCAFDVPGETCCLLIDRIGPMLAKMRGRRC